MAAATAINLLSPRVGQGGWGRLIVVSIRGIDNIIFRSNVPCTARSAQRDSLASFVSHTESVARGFLSARKLLLQYVHVLSFS